MGTREDEIADLKRRLAALEAEPTPATFAPAPPVRPPAPPPRPKSPPDWVFVAGALAIGVAAIGITVLIEPKDAAAPVAKAEAVCDVAAATTAYNAAQASGLIRGVDMTRGEGVVVMVSPRRWRSLDWSNQQWLAMQLDCGISGGKGHLVRLRFRVDRSGEDLAVFESWDLLRLREAQAAAKTP
jgi:hypothetical protein